MAGSLATVYAYLRVRIFDVPLARSILIIGVWYFFDALAKLLSSYASQGDPTSAFCVGMGAFVEITGLASILWMLFITVQLVLLVGWKWTKQQVLALNFTFLVISGVVPLIAAITLLVLRPAEGGPTFGNAVTWCWVSMKHPRYQLAALYIPLYVILLVVLGSFGYMAYIIYGHLKERTQREREKSIDGEIDPEKLKEQKKRDPLMHFARGASVYLLVFLLGWIPSSLSRFHKIMTGESSIPLLYAQSICTVLRGLFNFCLFAFLAWQNKKRQEDLAENTISTIKKRPSVA